jgi:hypothetical protein
MAGKQIDLRRRRRMKEDEKDGGRRGIYGSLVSHYDVTVRICDANSML